MLLTISGSENFNFQIAFFPSLLNSLQDWIWTAVPLRNVLCLNCCCICKVAEAMCGLWVLPRCDFCGGAAPLWTQPRELSRDTAGLPLPRRRSAALGSARRLALVRSRSADRPTDPPLSRDLSVTDAASWWLSSSFNIRVKRRQWAVSEVLKCD